MEQTNGIKTWQWVVTVAVIIVLVILGYNMFKGSSNTPVTPVDESTTTGTDATATNSVNSIMVADQAPGNIVYISSVQLSKPGYVVIHKDNKGMPGDVIGYKYFDKGIYPGQITLTSPTVNGRTYYAMLHSDDGDKKFDITKDLPIKNAAGNIIIKPFKATVNPAELKG